MLDYGKTTPPLPSECQALALRMLSLNTSFLSDSNGSLIKEDNRYQTSTALTQLTVNEYLPGQGIAQHTGISYHVTDPIMLPIIHRIASM